MLGVEEAEDCELMFGLLPVVSGPDVLPLVEPVVLCSLEVELPTLPLVELLLALFGGVLLNRSLDLGVWSFIEPVLP